MRKDLRFSCRPFFAALLCPLLITLATGCGPSDVPFVERPTQAVFSTGSSDFWSMPLPHDLRLGEDGSPGLSAWPGAIDNGLVDMWLVAADERLDGWGLTTAIFVPMSGDIDPSTLPATPAATLEAASSVFLIDVDPASPQHGQRLPLEVSWLAEADRWQPGRLLAAAPVFGFPRRPATTYALVVTDGVLDADGQAIGRTPAFHDSFEDRAGASPKASAMLSPLKATLTGLGVDTARVVSVAPLTTVDPNRDIRTLAEWSETRPLPAVAPWALFEDYESYQTLIGSFTVPTLQTGRRPYKNEGEGLIEWNPDRTPIVTGEQEVRLILTIPKSAQPAEGFPITIYAHGSGGNGWEAVERGARDEVPKDEQQPAEPGTGPAEWLARRGIATIGLDFNMHGTRHNPPDTSGLVFYNLFGNISATIDNFSIASGVELVLLSRLVANMTVDASLADTLDAGEAADGLIRFDEERIFGMGQSMGSTLTIPWATVDPRVRALVYSGAGGMLVQVAVTATEPLPLREVLESFLNLEEGHQLHVAHPLLHAMQNLWDLVDPIAKARHVALEPHPGHRPRSFLMPAGFRDGYFHPRAQAAVAAALGATMIGEPVEPILADVLALAGRPPVSYPLESNLGDEQIGYATGGVTHYTAPHTLGHYVSFNQDRVKHQYTCFLASAGTKIAAPSEEATAPCE